MVSGFLGITLDFVVCFLYIIGVKLDLTLLYFPYYRMNTKKEFFDYYEWWRSQKENVGRSFTRGSALHDFLKSSIRVHDYNTIRDMIEESVERQYSLTPGTCERFSYNALLELCDISELDQICNYLFFNEEDHETID